MNPHKIENHCHVLFYRRTNQPITVYGDGKQTRSFCYITDTATGLLLLATCEKAKGEAVNVGNTQEVTILELAKNQRKLKMQINHRISPTA
ncbi:NAD-dependent epimerase/dehydratase family protein [Candidatus Bathyarchaeota archaeon]|nr:NAD-dependent epimerase/dehydratase family protein [Candidatus Bathyarchaeota archaeon]